MGDVLRNISIAWSLVHCVVMFLMLFESRFSRKKTIIFSFAAFAPLIVLNVLLLFFLGIEKTCQLLIVSTVLPSFILCFFMSKHKGLRFIFTFCLVDTITSEIIILSGILDRAINAPNAVVLFVSRLFIFPILEFFLVKYLRKSYHKFLNTTSKGWGIFSLMSALFYVLVFVASMYPSIIWSRPDDYFTTVLIALLMPIMYITVFRVLFIQSELIDSHNEAQILDMQIKIANERIATDAETESRLKTLRHDLRHHMLLLNDYIKNGETQKALEHISSVTDYIDSTMPKQFCLNGVVNVILSHYDTLTQLKGIDFICEVSLSRQLPLADIDLVVVLSNALENAVNALEICDTKWIAVKGFESDGKFFFEVKNPFCGEIEFQDNLPVSRRENHGYGTKSIAAIVEKHEGIYSFTVEDDIFVFRCAI